jgi:hypothetical protein
MQYQSITDGTHPIWGEEYLCPVCRVKLCSQFLDQIDYFDQLYMFAEPVTESVASNYFDIIRNPMDLSTMKGKNERGHYKSLQPFRQDAELMCLNALIFNREGDEVWLYTARYFQMIEQFFNNSEHKTRLTAFGIESQEILKKSDIDVSLNGANRTAKKRKANQPLEKSSADEVKSNTSSKMNLLEADSNKMEIEGEENETEENGEQGQVGDEVDENNDGEEVEEEELPTINIYLQPNPEPSSFISPFMILQSAEDAYYSVALDVCLVCGSAGSSETFLFCIDCGEAFHRFCCSAPQSMNSLAKCTWRCPNCKICELCGLANESDVDNLILCECCDKAYHIQCLQPTLTLPLPLQPNGKESAWFCSLCVDCGVCSKQNPHVENGTLMKCWGYDQQVCISCVNKPKLLACNNCFQSDPVPNLVCDDCESYFHSVCSTGSVTSPSYRSYATLCKPCLEKECQVVVSHLGNGVEAYQLLQEIAEIQSIREERRKVANSLMKDYLNQQFQNEIIDENIYLLIVMSLWGNVRQLFFEENRRATESVINKRSEILPENSMQFMPAKARRYLNYLRRYESKANANRKNSTNNDSQISYEGLLRLSSLASNFTFVSDLEGVNLKHGLIEILVVFVEIGILYCKKYPERLQTRQATAADPTSISKTFQLYRIENMLIQFYQALGIPLLAVNRITKLFTKFGHLLPTSSDKELTRIARAMQLYNKNDLKIIENFVYDGFKDLGEDQRNEFSNFLWFIYEEGATAINNKNVNLFLEQTTDSSAEQIKVNALRTPLSSMHKLLERFQAARKHLICKSMKIRVEGIEGHEDVLNHSSSTIHFKPNAHLLTAADEDYLQQQPSATAVTTTIESISGSSAIPSQTTVYNRVQIDEECKTLQSMLSTMKAELLQELENKEDFDSVDPEALFHNYRNKYLAETVSEQKKAVCDERIPVPGEEAPLNAIGNDDNDKMDIIPASGEEEVKDELIVQADHATEERVEDDEKLKAEIEEVELPEAKAADNCSSPSVVGFQALKGWNRDNLISQSPEVYQLSAQQQTKEWTDYRACLFCANHLETPMTGRLLPFSDGALTHANCLLWCVEVTLVGAQLVNAESARRRCASQTCYFCLKRGATINCSFGGNRRCKRAYHLSCAIHSKCLLLEKLNSITKSIINSPSSCDYEACCPEHVPDVGEQQQSASLFYQYQNWQPVDPLKCLVVETCTAAVEMENVAKILSQGRTDVALKSGAVTILKIGKPLLDKSGFSTTKHIYPHHFMSCRIFWSMRYSGQRTVYFFDILEKTDFENWDIHQLSYLQKCLLRMNKEYPVKSKENNEEDLSERSNNNDDLFDGAIFRVTSLDALDQPIFSKNLDQLYQCLIQQISTCFQTNNSSSSSSSFSSYPRQSRRSNFSYNLTSHQFFGLGLPFVQEAIEMIPESIMSMINMNISERYSPSYRLPSQLDITNILKYQNNLQSKSLHNVSLNGASRADPYQEKIVPSDNVSIKITRTKNVGGDANDTSTIDETVVNEEVVVFTDLNKENSKAELESRKLRFLDMTQAYIRNPYAKLEVKKSRIHGWGLFSKINYEKDDVIIEYIGEKIRTIVADERELNYEKEGVGSCYLFR